MNAELIRNKVRELVGDEDLVIPEDALVEQVEEDGYWVQARVWIPASSLPQGEAKQQTKSHKR